MSTVIKSPALLKTEALASVGTRLTGLLRQLAVANSLLTDGAPMIPAAQGQPGSPALTAAEIKDVVGAENLAKLQAAIAAAAVADEA